MGLNLVLLAAPPALLARAFGALDGGSFAACLGVLAALAVVTLLFGRRHPVALVHPWAWRRKPWLFAAYAAFLWAIVLLAPFAGPDGKTAAYPWASLAVAVWIVLLTTPGREAREREPLVRLGS